MPLRMLVLWSLALLLTIAGIFWPDRLEMKAGALAKITSLSGTAQIRTSGSLGWKPAQVGIPLRALDTLSTGDESRVQLNMENDTTISLSDQAQIKLQGSTLFLIRGKIEVERDVNVATPLLIQTKQYRVDLSRLNGPFSLDAAGKASATQAETVRVESAKGAVNLAVLLEKEGSTLLEQLENSIAIPKGGEKESAEPLQIEEPLPTSILVLPATTPPSEISE